MTADAPLLSIRGLEVRYATPDGEVAAVDGVDLDVARGECIGLVGESGSGKTQLALATVGLVGANARVAGSVRLRGQELLGRGDDELAKVRGARIGFAFQDAMTALAPHLTVGTQLAETVRAHRDAGRRAARDRALAMLERVRIPDAARRLDQYPHELSGGLRQRAMLALALVAEPELLVADEPTTALDVTVQAEVLSLLRALRAELGLAVLLVTHDFGVVAGLCDRVAVMYAGRIVEEASTTDLFRSPRHPYAAALLAATPRLDGPLDGPLATLPGRPPAPHERPAGCAFRPRCDRAVARCVAERPALATESGRRHACHAPLGAST